MFRDLRALAAEEIEGAGKREEDEPREAAGFSPRIGHDEYRATMAARVDELCRRAEALGVRGSMVGKRGQEIERRAASSTLFAQPIAFSPDLS